MEAWNDTKLDVQVSECIMELFKKVMVATYPALKKLTSDRYITPYRECIVFYSLTTGCDQSMGS
jgi:hypothetical protein